MDNFTLEIGKTYVIDRGPKNLLYLYKTEKHAMWGGEAFNIGDTSQIIDKIFTVVSNKKSKYNNKYMKNSAVGILIENQILYLDMKNDRYELKKFDIREICDDYYLEFSFGKLEPGQIACK